MILQNIKKNARAIVGLSVMIGAVIAMIVVEQGTLVDVLIYLVTAMWVFSQTLVGNMWDHMKGDKEIFDWIDKKDFCFYILFAIGMSIGWVVTYLANIAVGAFFILLFPDSSHHPTKSPVR